MGVLLQICCIFSDHLFLGTPLGGCFWSMCVQFFLIKMSVALLSFVHVIWGYFEQSHLILVLIGVFLSIKGKPQTLMDLILALYMLILIYRALKNDSVADIHKDIQHTEVMLERTFLNQPVWWNLFKLTCCSIIDSNWKVTQIWMNRFNHCCKHCVKSVQIRSHTYFPAFGLNTDQKWLRIWTLFTQWRNRKTFHFLWLCSNICATLFSSKLREILDHNDLR